MTQTTFFFINQTTTVIFILASSVAPIVVIWMLALRLRSAEKNIAKLDGYVLECLKDNHDLKKRMHDLEYTAAQLDASGVP